MKKLLLFLGLIASFIIGSYEIITRVIIPVVNYIWSFVANTFSSGIAWLQIHPSAALPTIIILSVILIIYTNHSDSKIAHFLKKFVD